ncbi:MAG: alpha-2-macroglobulin, partial [Planctomycetes bacterium]|nr:alpha-2-macroglobulin [Planctomycetota bacterium]
MRRDGRFVPQSPDEVARAEADIDESAVELPPGLRDPLAILSRAPAGGAADPTLPSLPDHVPSEPSSARTSPDRVTPEQENPMRGTWFRKMIAWLVVAGTVATVAGYQFVAWRSKVGDVRDRELALQSKRDELNRVLAEQAAAQKESRKDLDAALAAEAELRARAAAEYERARKAITEKDFVVRLTGPAHVQPGAPNKWQIETLRHGAVARPKKLDVVVKDAKDVELFRQTHDKPVGAATLELTAAFWQNVKPGTELFLNVVAHTDDRATVLADRLPLARPVYVTHLVTDKPLYKPGEVVRFRSLTLDRSSLRPPEHDLHLIFRLRDPADAVTPLDEGNGRLLRDLQPVMGSDKKALRGLGVGEHLLSADAPGGEYKLDLLERGADGKDVLLETRKFVVNRYVPDTFEKRLEFDGKSYGPGEFVQARIEVSRTAGGPMRGAKANVVASADGKVFHELKDAPFSAITDAGGTKTVLDVRFKLPATVFDGAKPDVSPSATLSVTIQDGSDTEAIVRPIPLVTKNLKVEFFPEGGEMIAGVPGRVYFMVRTPGGKPADLKGTITDGTNTVAEVATLTDAENPGVNRGHGAFTLKPEPGKRYFLKLTAPVGIVEPTKDGFPLPDAKPDGVALTALDPITVRGGAVRVRVQSPLGPKVVHVGAYVREHLVAQQKLVLQGNVPAEVALKGDDSAGGVTRVTVFEESRDDAGRAVLVPRAERLTFREPGEQLVLQANPDKSRYSPSDKVKLDLAALDEKGRPTPAVLLVGVVNRSVITMADNKHDRLQSTHFLLSGEVKNSAELEHADFLLTDHPRAAVALDLLLGTQGWRRFAEQDVAPANPADRADVEKMLVAHGARPSAPFELTKLEEQRLAAEYAPRLELARLRVVAAGVALSALPPVLIEKLTAARVGVSVAEAQQSDAAGVLRRFESRYVKIRDAFFWAVLIALALVVLYVLARFAWSAARSGRRGRVYLAAACGVAVVGFVAIVVLFQTQFDGAKGKKEAAAPRAVGSALEPVPNAMSAAPPAPNFFAAREGIVPPATDGFATPEGITRSHALPLDPKTSPQRTDAPKVWDEAAVAGVAKVLRESARKGKAAHLSANGQADMAWLAAAIVGTRPRNALYEAPPWAGVGTFTSEAGTTAPAIPGLLMRDPVPGRPYTMPFVVREYAHQRDSSLGEVRADFTETVYWHPVLVLPENGKASVEFQLSDDIARYQVLVAGHTLDGRVGAITKTIEARKPFSVDPKLPLEIAHTDTVDVPVRVTNDSDVRRSVSLATTLAGFKAAGPQQDALELAPNAKGRKLLRLTADKLDGDASVLVAGTSGADKDTVLRTIRVVPDGFPGVGSVSDMMEGRARGTIALPKDVVPGSLRVRLEVYPTSMADLVKGLDGLLREPHGCFEQTSTSNYPNAMILDYITQTNQANPQTAARARDFLARGYGRLTSFECPDTPTKGRQGYEWFGAADRPHLALTAYGLLQFKDMARVHPVDPQMIKRTQSFLLSRRDGQGGFRQPADGHSFGSAPQRTVDAYVVWALVESDPEDAEKLDLRTEIAALKAEALNENTVGGKDPYFVALAANVLLLRGDRETAHRLLDRLQEKHTKGGVVTGAVTSITRSGGRDLDIETTALALLGWLRANDPKYAATVKDAAKWISQQRGGYGGFGSTQSTILALKALTLFAKKSAHPAESGEIRVTVGGRVIGTRRFTEKDVEVIGLDIANPDAVFKPGQRTEVEIVTDAKQAYPFALSYTYTSLTPVSAEKCAVQISTRLGKADASEGDAVPLHVTFENKVDKGHGMAVAVIGIPAGMKVPTDMKQLTDLREKGSIAYFETRGRELVLYWRSLAPKQKIELTVDLVCEVPGTYRGPASRGYLYYDADHKHWVEPLA